MGQLVSWDTVQRIKNLGDSFTNFLSGINTIKSKGANQTPALAYLTRLDQENLYRGDWISRKIIDTPAFDMTRAWRTWEASQEQIEALEAAEKAFGLQRKMMSAMIKARLYGGAALIIGIEGQQFNEELDLDSVKKDSLQFVHVVSKWDIAAGAIVRDVGSPWFGEPAYYERTNMPTPLTPGNVNLYNGPPLAGVVPGQVLYIHPSRVVRLIGFEYPNIESAQDAWGDSVLQPVYEAIRDSGLVTSSVAEALAELKIDIVKVQGLSNLMSTTEGSNQLIRRFSNANAAKSVVNTLMLDETETYERHTITAAGLEKVIETFVLLCAGAADIPATRLMGRSPAGMDATGESDTRNYYDRLHADQMVRIGPALSRLDEVLIRSVLGSRPDEVHYLWNPLWQMDEVQKAAVAYQKAQAFQIDANIGLINPEVLREARINQLIEDGTYPGIEAAIDEFGAEPDEDDINEKAANAASALHEATNPPENDNDEQPKKKTVGDAFDPNEERGPDGRWSGSGGGGSSSKSVATTGKPAAAKPETKSEGGGKYGLVPGDVEKYRALKDQWSKVNNELLTPVARRDPGGPEATAALSKLQAIVKEIHGLHADPGGPAGIGLPGGPRDVLIVGAGPGGLTAGIHGAAEGLDTLVVEADVVPGGQAKQSSRIENYPGFPVGVTGEQLTQDMFTQAERLGAETKLGVRVLGMTIDADGMKHVSLSNGETIDSRTVIIGGGIEFRKIPFPGSDGPGVVFGDNKKLLAAAQAAGKGGRGNICIVGGSNGAAQSALKCASVGNHVYVLSRSPIDKGMSAYQTSALRNNPDITVIEKDEISKLDRDSSGAPQTLETKGGQKFPVNAVGVFAGGIPNTKWVPEEVSRDYASKNSDTAKLRTNANYEAVDEKNDPIPGLYAIGDMRDGGAGRVIVAAGEGAMALRQANVYLDAQKPKTEKKTDSVTIDSNAPTFSELVTRLFALDVDHPWFGQTIDPDDLDDDLEDAFKRSATDIPFGVKDVFDPNEERNEQGEWSGGGGGGGSGSAANSGGANLWKTQEKVYNTPQEKEAGHIMEMLKTQGGVSYNTNTSSVPQKGFITSPYPEHERTIDAKDLTPADVVKYMIDKADVLKQPGNHLGLWHNKADGKVYFDVTVVMKTAEEAEKLSIKAEQLAYFDLENLKEVNVGTKENGVYTPLRKP